MKKKKHRFLSKKLFSFLDDDLSPGFGDLNVPISKQPKTFNIKEIFAEELSLVLQDKLDMSFTFSAQKENTLFETQKEVEFLCAISAWIIKVFQNQDQSLPKKISQYLNECELASTKTLENLFIALKKINAGATHINYNNWKNRENMYLEELQKHFPDVR